MASPTTAINRFDLSLSYSEFSLLSNQNKFRGLQVLPPVGVGDQSANYRRIKIASVLGPIRDTNRAPDGTYRRDDFEWETDSYQTEEHGVEEKMDDRTLKVYKDEIRAEQIHAMRAVNRVLIAFEDAVSKAVFNTSTWTGASLTTTVGTAWSVHANAKPIDDIDGAIEKVEDNSGEHPNALVVTDVALRHAKRTAQIEDLLKYSGRDDPKNLGLISGLQELLDLERIIVCRGYKNTADEGQTPTFARLWDKTMAMVCHIDDSEDLESMRPHIGRTIMWNEENAGIPGADDDTPGLIIEEYREDRVRGSVLRARFDRQIKIHHKEAGHLLQGLVA